MPADRRRQTADAASGINLLEKMIAASAISSRFLTRLPAPARFWAIVSLNFGEFSSTTARHRFSFRLKCLNSVPSAQPAFRAISLVVSPAKPSVSIKL